MSRGFSHEYVNDPGLSAALGRNPLITEVTKVNKFGETTNADSATKTDVWNGSTTTPIWVPPTAARIHAIVSGSANDTSAGIGVRTVRVYGLKTWDLAETNEVVIMNGATPVNTVNSYVIIHRIESLTWGTGGVNAGLITATAATDGTITAEIAIGENQTQMLIYGVPSIQSLQIKHLRAEIVKGTGITQRADGELLIMLDPATNVLDNTAWTNKENFLAVEGENPWTHDYDLPKSISGPCISKVQVTANANDTKCIAAMDAYIVNN